MRDTTKIHPLLQVYMVFGLKKCYDKGLNIRFTETLRTIEEQNEFYRQGTSQVKGDSYGSMHQWGVAFDVCRNDGASAYDFNGWIENVAKIFKSYNLAWGGDWKGFVDKPHFQMADYEDSYGGTSSLKRNFINPTKFLGLFNCNIGIEQFANLNIANTKTYIKKHFATSTKSIKLYKGTKCMQYTRSIPKGTDIYIVSDNKGISKVIYLKGNKFYSGYVYNHNLNNKNLSTLPTLKLKKSYVIYKDKVDKINKKIKIGAVTKNSLAKGITVKILSEKDDSYRIYYQSGKTWKTVWIKK